MGSRSIEMRSNANTRAENMRSDVHVPAACRGALCTHHQARHMRSGGKDSDDNLRAERTQCELDSIA
jgi:hypothetical protein